MDEISLIVEPDAEEPGTASLFVDGSLNGRPYRFLLDTGAARTCVSFDDYTTTFASVEKNHSSGVFARNSDDLITVPSLVVGPIYRSDFTLVRTGVAGTGTRSLIGMDLLKDFCCHFCFDVNRLLLDPDDALDDLYQALTLDQKYHPYVSVQLGDVAASAVWDTGASLTVVDTGFIQHHPQMFQAAGYSTGTDSSGAQMETPMLMMAGCRIGGYDFPPQRVAGVDLSAVNAAIEIPMDMILGYNTLCQANWVFDFPRRRWMISKWLGNL